LIMSGCSQLTNSTLFALESCCTHLTSVNLSRSPINDKGLAFLLSSFLPLQRIDLSFCTDVSGTCFSNKALPSLRNVELSSMDLTNPSAGALAHSAPNLTHITLVSNSHLSDFGVGMLVSICKNLCYLDLSCCPAVTDRSLGTISRHSLRLETLMLTCCQQISDAGLQFLSEGCDNLRFLNLTNCPKVTDVSLGSIALLRSLRKLDLYRCAGVTPRAMRQLLTSNPLLHIDF